MASLPRRWRSLWTRYVLVEHDELPPMWVRVPIWQRTVEVSQLGTPVRIRLQPRARPRRGAPEPKEAEG